MVVLKWGKTVDVCPIPASDHTHTRVTAGLLVHGMILIVQPVCLSACRKKMNHEMFFANARLTVVKVRRADLASLALKASKVNNTSCSRLETSIRKKTKHGTERLEASMGIPAFLAFFDGDCEHPQRLSKKESKHGNMRPSQAVEPKR